LIKISRNTIIAFFVLAAAAVSVHPLLAIAYLPYKLFLVLGIIFTAAFFMAKDIKTDKNIFFHAVIFTAGAALIGAGQYVFSFFKHNIMIYGVVMIFCGTALIAAAQVKYGQKKDSEKTTADIKTEIAAVAVLTVIAFLMRFWDLSGFLPGVWFDEAQNGMEALRIKEGNNLEIFISRYTHMPAMYFYFASLSIKIFGFNIFALRFVSCILGTLSVIAFYFLAKHVFKNWKYALLAAFLLAFSRWHITFSRVAFLGMQTVFFEILFMYFYLKFLETKGIFYALLAGLILGISQYTFSAANFIVIFAFLHITFMVIKDMKAFVPKYASGVFIMAVAALLAAGPLLVYAAKNKAAFFQRARDISIMKDIRDNKNIGPLFKNLRTYGLVFNFEGDYNGRHNLYKKPILDDFGGVFFLLGLIAALTNARYRFFSGFFLVMLLPGIMTITIEAPQTYRILGVIPAVYLLMTLGIKTAAGVMAGLSADKRAGISLAVAAALASAAVNFHQYFFLYPKHEGTYMSFSPEANGVAEFIKSHMDDYEIIISTARKMYGFYGWEQSVICDFINYGKGKYGLLSETNEVSAAALGGKKGVVLVTRPLDTAYIDALEKQYAGRIEKKEIHTNPFSGKEIYTCWFIKKENLLNTPGKTLYVK
jgi:4-amino-4-deoxy-L-arabinose transferase-like glycosyltransferase